MSGADSGEDTPIPSLDSRTGGRRKPRLQQPRRMRPWLISAGLLVAVWSFVTSLGMIPREGLSSSPEMFGYLLGGVLGAGLFIGGIVALIVHLAAGRRLTPGYGLRNFAILAGVAMLAAVPLAVVRMQAFADIGAIRQQEAAIMADYRARTDAVIVRTGLRERTAASQARMLPQAVAAPGGLARARQANEELRVLQATLLTELATLMSDVEGRLQAITKTDRQREELRQNIETNRAVADRSMEIAQRAVELRGAQLDVLARQPRGWEVQGDTLAFSRQRDLDHFNRLATELEALKAEIAQIQTTADDARP